MNTRTRWAAAMVAVVLSYCVLSFYRASDAAPPAGNAPFANSVQQRVEMITELKGIRALLKEQNLLLRQQNSLLGGGVKPTDPTKER